MRHTLNDDTAGSNMDLPMSPSGRTLLSVTLWPGFEPRDNIRVLTRGQGTRGATCANYHNSNSTHKQTSSQKQHIYNLSHNERSGAVEQALDACSSSISSSIVDQRAARRGVTMAIVQSIRSQRLPSSVHIQSVHVVHL